MKILIRKTFSIVTSLMFFLSMVVVMPLEFVHADTIQANMLLWHKFDANSGTDVIDYWGNRYSGTLVG